MVQAPTQKFTFEEYLVFDDGTDARYELVNGLLVPMNPPQGIHAIIAGFLFSVLYRYCEKQGSLVASFSHGVRTGSGKSRLPDLVVMTEAQSQAVLHESAILDDAPLLAVEIVSPDNPSRDYREKRSEYAARDIPEYWIVDPQQQKVTVLTLIDGLYEEAVLRKGDFLKSKILPGLELSVEHMLKGRSQSTTQSDE
ncbi:MAG: Uma2 family endonuclease [Leptolyngbyaceae bacterium]|nr:Uma2 family endonuclease [Leptolyngbyaceae bacterium]